MRKDIGLYRGKRKDNGEWVEGAYYKQTHYYGDPCERHYIITSTESLDYDQAFEYYEVDPETVGEYTSLTNKNGKKIFEGDIVKGAWNTILVIYYDDCYTQFRAKHKWGENEISYYGDINKLEVIGNIHDNPELLQAT